MDSPYIKDAEVYNKPNDSYTYNKMIDCEGRKYGRVDTRAGENGTPLFMHDLIPKNEKTNYSNAMKYDHPNTLLSTTFFSLENIKLSKMEFDLAYTK